MIFSRPLKGKLIITQDFEQHKKRAIANGWCWKPEPSCPKGWYYPGIDYGVMKGTDFFDAMDGVVKRIKKEVGGYGLRLEILHPNGYMTLYAHLSEIRVQEGWEVKRGDLLGKTGNTGNSTGPHLHFELRDEKGIPIDPEPLFDTDIGGGEEPLEEPFKIGDKIMAFETVNMRKSPQVTPMTDVGNLDPGLVVEVIGVDADPFLQVQAVFYVHKDFMARMEK